jgi:hypothetical protein
MRMALRFTLAVIEEWKGWLSGSLPMVVLATIAWIYPQIAPLPILDWAALVFVAGFACAVFRVYRKAQSKLDAISLKRPFMFETFKMVGAGPFGSLTQNQYHFLITLCFENRGDEMIDFTMIEAYAEINGVQTSKVLNHHGRFVHPHEKFSFSLPRATNVSVPGFPCYVDIFFNVSYDTIEPTKIRYSSRKIKYIGYNLDKPETWTNTVIEQSET